MISLILFQGSYADAQKLINEKVAGGWQIVSVSCDFGNSPTFLITVRSLL